MYLSYNYHLIILDGYEHMSSHLNIIFQIHVKQIFANMCQNIVIFFALLFGILKLYLEQFWKGAISKLSLHYQGVFTN